MTEVMTMPVTLATMNDLPAELMDRIALEALSARDVVSLTLLNKAWRSTLFPDHLRYMKVSASAADATQWGGMSDVPRRASLVRRLKLTGGPELLSMTEMTVLASAGRHLTGLKYMEMRVERLGDFHGLFESLREACPDIYELKINGCRPNATDPEAEIRVMELLGGYKCFAWNCPIILQDNGRLMCAIGRMLTLRCPALRQLSLSQLTALSLSSDIHLFWATTRLPALLSLHLDRVEPHDLTPQFLEAHPTLESFTITGETTTAVPVHELAPTALPAIKYARMRCSNISAYAILAAPLPDGTRRPIHTMRIHIQTLINSGRAGHSMLLLCGHLRNLSTLTRLEFSGTASRDGALPVSLIGGAVPHVKELALAPRHSNWTTESVDEWLYAVSTFRGLETVSGLCRLGVAEVDSDITLVEAAQALAPWCRSLRMIDSKKVTEIKDRGPVAMTVEN